MAVSAARRTLFGGVAVLAVAAGALAVASADPAAGPPPTTPIKHVVVIFGENQSFDHYFGTYPIATNPRRRAALHGAAPARPRSTGCTPDLLDRQPEPRQPAPRSIAPRP